MLESPWDARSVVQYDGRVGVAAHRRMWQLNLTGMPVPVEAGYDISVG